ncbi:amino acid adenylation domain-containing protein [Actinomadura madurae]|uniref:amino acid adenylation domain-containing protein n=1 Tax=Actinomadura madurae TaxID=1993 RepID=UPI00399A3009
MPRDLTAADRAWPPAGARAAGPTVPDRFTAVAARHPGRIAVVSDGRRITYGELDARIDLLARRLVRAGVRRDAVVAVVTEDGGADSVVAAFAAWRAGGAYMPVDPASPAARIRRMLAGVSPAALVGAPDLVRAAGVGTGVIEVPHAGRPPRRRRPETSTHLDDLAYVIHTSGSTGEPKAVAVPHRALAAAYAGWAAEYDLLDSPRTCLQGAGPAFDVHIADIVRALCSGGRLVLCRQATLLDPAALWRLLTTESVDTLELTPSVIRLLVEWMSDTGARLDRVRLFISGGEQWRTEEFRRLAPLLAPTTRIVNSYGVAEAGIDSTYHEVTEESVETDAVPIGRPFPGVEVAVLDPGGNEVPPGAVGELHLGGPGLARGYHGRPAETAQRFLPDGAGGRRYRTGDLVRRRADGALVHVGRSDNEVKVRGVRVGLDGVEATLRRHPEVRDAAVLLERVGGQGVLIAHVVAAAAPPPPGLGDTLKRYLAESLPPAAVPAEVRVHGALPLSASGKVDRRALASGAEPAVTAFRPADDIERTLGEQWALLVGRPPRTATESLFQAGGDSLTAARLAIAIRRELSVEVSAGTVLTGPTIRQLAAAVQAADPVAPVAPSGPVSAAPFTLGQHSLWLLHQFDPADPAYHLPTVVRLTGDLRVNALRSALDALIARHDALRCHVHVAVNGPELTVRDPMPCPFEVVDAGGRPGETIERFVGRPFDLTCAPLIRAALVRHDGDLHDLVIVVHHLVFDDWSERVLLRELGRLYSAAVTGTAPDLPRLSIGSAELAVRRAAVANGSAGAPQREYWRRTLADPPAPPALPAPATGPAAGGPGRHAVRLDAALAGRIRRIAGAHQVTPYVLLLAGLSVLLRRWSGERDLIVGVPLGHRDRPETLDMIGFLVATLPLRLTVDDRATFGDLLSATGRALAEGAGNAEVPVDRILHDLRSGARRRNQLFRVWFNWLGAPAAPPSMTGLITELAEPPVPGALFDLSIYVAEHGDELRLDLVYDTAALDAGHAVAFLDQFVALLERFCRAPDRPVAHHVPGAGARPPADLRTRPPDLVRALADTVAGHRDGIAVRDASGRGTSYGELYAAAAEQSTALVAAGVRAGDTVPVLAARVPELVTAMLGVLGAGAAFAVLDAGHPAARLAEQLAVLDAPVGITVAGPVSGELRETTATWLVPPPPRSAASWPVRDPDPRRHTYAAFTSGTTGYAQPVRAGQPPLANFLSWYTERFAIDAADRFALLSGLGHDPLLRDVLTPLWAGATLCVPPDLLRRPVELLDWLAAESVTVLHATPALCRLLSLPLAVPPLPELRLLCCAGDLLMAGDLPGIRRWAPNATVINGYGTTETPQIVGFAVVAESGALPAASVLPVGRGVPGAELLVVDGSGRPAAIGELGTVTVRSPYLADAYAGALPGRAGDPIPGHHRFATGDIGRLGPDGQVTVLGRTGSQIQVRGFRVELAEIDRRLRVHPDVRDAAATGRPGPDGEARIVAHLVAEPGTAPTLGSIRAHLRRTVPDHMLPAAVHLVPQIPLTRNGKVDRARLGDAPGAVPAPAPPSAATAPRTELERTITAVWEEVLGHDRVGAEENFFDLGATSLLLTKAHVRLQQVTARAFPVTVLFEHTTVRGLAGYLAGEEAESPRPVTRRARYLAEVRGRRLAARSAACPKETST